ncbi:hypothetical protein YM02_003316 [Salmonella enterica subsp. enterica]|nr:hypothetical protein [Salmonella enterica subsp. enterica serovar Paratyphi A]EDQ9811688.1 hypothetical protein [Salmonella enterica subsp. enterica serovar Paratyphi A]EEI7706970.1 hypothetical protein [Salmonella enterica subsp. enterica serovar Paratyphi A]
MFYACFIKESRSASEITDNAKLFISFINIGIVSCALLLFFILYEPESAIVTYSLPGELSSSTCDAHNFIGYVDANDFAEYIKKVELTRYNMYCLKKTGAGQWSIYAN